MVLLRIICLLLCFFYTSVPFLFFLEGEEPFSQVSMVSRVSGDRILALENGKWTSFFVKGVNFGLALPGKYPSQYPTRKEDYLRWFRLLSEMNANSIRVYNILPPVFYEAFLEYNSIPENPKLWLIHGIWPPPGKDFFDKAYVEEFQAEMKHVVDIIHGNASFPPRPGHSGGEYSSDISKFVLAFLIGKEWEPDIVYVNDKNYSEVTSYEGTYFRIKRGSPTECFLARTSDYILGYEYEKYGWQRPVSFINWPTLDPIHHPTEHVPGEDIEAYLASYRWHNDAATVDETKIAVTPLNEAGFFASYHIYPWNPDFMNNDPGYSSYLDRHGHLNNYAGYLHDLKKHYSEIPIVVAEFGVPTSRGNAHRQPQGMHHGSHSEIEQGTMNSRMIEDIYDEGYAGGILFNWMDEWWKTNWLVNAFELHAEGRDRLWHNAQDPEEYFGLLAMDSVYKVRIDGEVEDWSAPFYQDPSEDLISRLGDGFDHARDLKALYLAADSTYLYMRLDVADLDNDDDGKVDWSQTGFLIGLDTYDRQRGDHLFPLGTGLKSPSGLEFVIELSSESKASILVDSSYSDYASPPTGKRRSQKNSDGKFEEIIIVTNRERIAEEGKVYPALYHNDSRMMYGSVNKGSSDYYTLADWYASPQRNAIELRIPWYLLHVADPTRHLVLDDDPKTPHKIETTKTTGFRIYVLSYKPEEEGTPQKAMVLGQVADLIPGGEDFSGEKDFLWEGWGEPAYKERLKDSYFIIKEAFGKIGKQVAIAPFRNDAEAAVSIVFDDGKLNQYTYALPILEKHGFLASFSITTSLLSPEKIPLEEAHLSQWMDWSYVRALSEKGHEIASHSVEHVALPELSPEEIVRNLKDSKVLIEKKIERPCISFVYPLAMVSPEVKKIAEETGYICARRYGASYNELIPDFYELKSFSILSNENPTLVNFTRWIIRAMAANRWLILVYHNVVPEGDPELIQWKKEHGGEDINNLYPSTFDSQMQLIRDSELWVAPLGEVARYLKERMHTRIQYDLEQDRIGVHLRCDLPRKIYNVPLTLKMKTSWRRVKVKGSLNDGVVEVKNGTLIVDSCPNSQIIVERVKPNI